jgi:hypothetical protein
LRRAKKLESEENSRGKDQLVSRAGLGTVSITDNKQLIDFALRQNRINSPNRQAAIQNLIQNSEALSLSFGGVL